MRHPPGGGGEEDADTDVLIRISSSLAPDMTTDEAAKTPLAIMKAGAVAVITNIGPGPTSFALTYVVVGPCTVYSYLTRAVDK
jgi:hypothetical protein